MPRGIKFDDTIYENIVYSGKIFIYNDSTWNTLYPIVEIIRLLKDHTIITHTYAKNQNLIKLYSSQYNHRVFGIELKTKKDYLENFKTTQCIYIFADTADKIATNIINMAEKNNIPIVCFSNLDSLYHFNGEKIKEAQNVIAKMYNHFDLMLVKKLDNLFPEFDILDEEPKIITMSTSVLEQCLEKMNITTKNEIEKKDLSKVKIFDPNLNRLKKLEYQRAQKKIVYDDDVKLNKAYKFTRFFKKEV